MEEDGREVEHGDTAAGDAAQAFEALRAEVTGLRRDIGALHTALIEHRGPDLTPTLGELAKAQQQAAKKLSAIEQHAVIRMTAEQYRQVLENAGSALVQDATRRVQEASWAVQAEAKRLAEIAGAVRDKRRQLDVVAYAAGAALLVGILLSPLLARLLPFGLDERVAALVLHRNRWDAGAALMAADNPGSYHALREAADLIRVNQAALEQCREAATKTKKEQHCTILMTVP